MSAVRKITGYEKRTERLERAFDVPADRLRDVRAIGSVPAAEEEALGSYPLDANAIQLVGLKLGANLNAYDDDWYLEPFSASDAVPDCFSSGYPMPLYPLNAPAPAAPQPLTLPP